MGDSTISTGPTGSVTTTAASPDGTKAAQLAIDPKVMSTALNIPGAGQVVKADFMSLVARLAGGVTV